MSAPPQVQKKCGTVKEVKSGDTIIIRGPVIDGPPPEIQLKLSNITAPKVARAATKNKNIPETKDEPYGWEAREFLRKKLIGQNVFFTHENPPKSTVNYGTVWLAKGNIAGENVTESLVSEGLVFVRGDVRNVTPELARLQELEEMAKAAGKGRFSSDPPSNHVRDVKWVVEDQRALFDKFGGKPIKAIIEKVRDGSSVYAFLLPDFYNITLMISGIRCPEFKQNKDEIIDEPYGREAQFFVEFRLLQRDVEIVLESVENNAFIGSILHPRGNIAEQLLEQGFAKCVDWSMNNCTKSVVEKMHLAEKRAKEQRLRRWKDNYVPSGPQISNKDREFTGIVTEIANNAESLIVKLPNGDTKKIFLSSIRPPREKRPPGEEGKITPRSKDFRPLYDIPWMLEAREFLRKKLVRKPVKVVVDYIQPAKDKMPEKVCCTVTIGKVNIAEAMVSKGLATVVKYKQNNDQRSSHYNDLLAAESKAEKSQYGVHAKKDNPIHRVTDLSGNPTKAKSHLASLKRARGTKAVVEFVTSGSRVKLYLYKESLLITFLLAGVKAPRGPRPSPGGGGTIPGEPYSEEALLFTTEHCLQREVEINVEGMDSKGSNFIGWLFVDGVNLSVALVEEGLAEVPSFGALGEHINTLKAAEERAKSKNLNIWKDRIDVEEETKKVDEEREVVKRKIDYREVRISEVTEELHFYAQNVDQGDQLEELLSRLRQELTANPPLPGAYNPKRGELAAAKFTCDDQWYRVKIEKVTGTKISVFYIDYGNRETLDVTRVASLPAEFASAGSFATEYALACVALPPDNDDKKAAYEALLQDIVDRTLKLNVEYKVAGLPHATLVDPETNDDIGLALVQDGYVLVANIQERRLEELIKEYKTAEDKVKAEHRNIWQYGDIREDPKEFSGTR
ncbi:staphylococcal nuclease domain-containing protein 1 [Cephus cinctus]|uniref:Staphylococcal nuclease domain-containing protein 1 n=1 Tax=Cephus cinctus TaxID=211228 RepID=A0AAJ7BVW2_CEPCN|nr:staphylococcal nuclease domain-containing protein 1 [Cephus cinctus]